MMGDVMPKLITRAVQITHIWLHTATQYQNVFRQKPFFWRGKIWRQQWDSANTTYWMFPMGCRRMLGQWYFLKVYRLFYILPYVDALGETPNLPEPTDWNWYKYIYWKFRNCVVEEFIISLSVCLMLLFIFWWYL